MPLYEFEHAIHLEASQKSAIAKAITNWHSTTFSAPKFIVACRFIDVSHGTLSETFIGGESRKLNRLFISLRSGAGRTPAQLESITASVMEIWENIVGRSEESELRAIYIKGNLDSALEGGFMLPMPGKFQEWVKANTDAFQKLADAGDVDMVGLMQEIQNRPEFQRDTVS